MSAAVSWKVSGLYFEACSCESVCPCYSGQSPTYGSCEGNGAWHIIEGQYGETSLDGLNVIMALRCDGHMRENKWRLWFFLDERATNEQFEALKQIFTAVDGGHLGKIFGDLWQVQSVERAKIEMKTEGWKHRASIVGKLGLSIGTLKTKAGPTLCRIPNVAGLAAIAEENWFDGEIEFNQANKNALTTTFEYHSEQ